MTHAALPLPPVLPDAERRTWLLTTGAMGVAATAAVAVPLVSSLAPSERAKAQGASVEVDISGLAPGEMATVEWRGKPVWILRRTPEMLAALERTADLADPASKKDQQPAYATNTARSIQPEVFVAVGICTHLGCSPVTLPAGTANPSVPADWQGGFFCPCHGSTFDFAGRVFKNKPAPTNLEVPPHRFLADNRLLIGEDGSGAG
ncbi:MULTISPECIES: ubiquinol-cytochrome c reductase iron-sulfur subunit [Hydrogenophaga]|uniref:Ubiquinol-cytochrome c reductase iron-sulfur subunit n=1 Tax=Hydrogenophaga electricum TaxID=1230953 RepID=A0ABQ6CAM1_9BURK|nr:MULTISPECIES: ubiquinol-cytochrome c reductase iron-sulfur subunit [Hydrogenophaga]GLS15749.1 ubiquinol-cytochrome c reductase iron-sulfur subunit [Hydrogenophaga electricum]